LGNSRKAPRQKMKSAKKDKPEGDEQEKENESTTIIGKISSLIGLYAIFIFLSGWTYLDYYYRAFGIYSRWLDISVAETFTKGFEILFQGGSLLWIIYVFVLVVPILFEVFPRFRKHIIVQILLACLLLSCVPLTYLIASRVGQQAGLDNQGDHTYLNSIRFSTECGTYIGNLLYIKDDTYYVHDLKLLSKLQSTSNCYLPSLPTEEQKSRGDVFHALTAVRANEIRFLEIAE
jgi:hypothetical protein